ncbi:DUF4199 domain-containing protein [Porphyromonas sp. oral taxon 275]|uniref:DUF4199 domain-containing protein n=1 Tax=Porphyromonas sp. oral taxon 275 TaxID=712435 RepID=UPI001BAD629B|nr:DUF4199 domain-containing protein [Porphyromonas sp. oral taxon 275]QUB43671.1 DUF4199 domain-containing protein [Porphyromonas sp. oral taxon 275]
MSTQEQDKLKPTASVARDGLKLGGVLCLTYLARILGLGYPFFSLIYFAGLILIPYTAYRLTKAYRDQVATPSTGFSWFQGLSYTLRQHVFGGILALIPQYFYFRYFVPEILDQLHEMLSSQPQALGQQLQESLASLEATPLWQWLWVDYCFTLFLGLVWGALVGLALRQRPFYQ